MPKVSSDVRKTWLEQQDQPFDLIIHVEGNARERSDELQALGFQVKRSFRLTNSISLRGTGKQALQLLDIPWVTRVEPDRPVHAYRR
ncbi:MAG: hypothetical protein GX552_10245 [Chloroflexi bacterium]|jgi:hypothetical protein|nr:hypothetical protein [Chloroflexota bacterium]